MVVTNSLVQESFVLAAIQQVWSQCPYKPLTRQLLFSVLQLFISIRMEECYTFKVRVLRMDSHDYFRL